MTSHYSISSSLITFDSSLKRLVIRENEERSVSRERLKSSCEKTSQSGDERRLIKLQTAMPKQEAIQPFDWRASSETEIMRDASNNSRQSSHRDYGGSLAQNDNLRKEADQSRQNASASKTRSTSMYDARPLTQGSKPERKESQLTPEQKQQIDLGTFLAVETRKIIRNFRDSKKNPRRD